MSWFNFRKWEGRGVPWTVEALNFELLVRYPAANTVLQDGYWRAIAATEFEEIIWKARPINPRAEVEYVLDKFDCNRYAIWFMSDVGKEWARLSNGKAALAFGMIHALTPEGGRHAFIWQLDDKGNMNFYEPQTNKRITWTPRNVTFILG